MLGCLQKLIKCSRCSEIYVLFIGHDQHLDEIDVTRFIVVSIWDLFTDHIG